MTSVGPPRLHALAPLLLLALLAPADAHADGYRKGAVVRIEGRVVDVLGGAVPRATVMLSASRQARRINPLRRGDQGPVSTVATSGADGRFAFDWVWDGYHDTFVLRVVLAAAESGEHEMLAELDISERLAGDNPVTVDIEVIAATLIRFAEHAARGLTADEHQVLAELGRPERYDTSEVDGGVESSWWYFARGRMVRFRDGALLQVVHFDPLQPDD